MPHGMCFLWRWDLLILHVGADVLIALAYFSIPAAMLVLLKKRPDLPRGVFRLFVAFILLCGITHLSSIVVIWYPAYVVEGMLKMATALVSVTTAILLWPLIPKAAALPSMQSMEQRNAEIEKLNARLLRRIDSLSTLAGGVSHDFNNLLTVIQGNAQMLLDPDSGLDPTTGLTAIEGASIRAERVCRQMLAYSGRGHFILQPCQLNAVIENTHLPRGDGITVQVHQCPDLPPIQASSRQLDQLVQDLCKNAVEAVAEAQRPDGRICVSTRTTVLDESELQAAAFEHDLAPGPVVLLEVEDNGVGMSPDLVERAFEPYQSTKFTGRGLGLAAVQGIVRGHGGSLFIKSEPNSGTRVRVAFPAEGVATFRFRQQSFDQPRQALVVDDEPEVLEVARRALQACGMEVETCDDPQRALVLLGQPGFRPQVLIVDYLMPQLTGAELIRQLPSDYRPDVYLTSGYSRQEISEPALQGRLTGFIAKPFDSGDFERLFGRLGRQICEPELEC